MALGGAAIHAFAVWLAKCRVSSEHIGEGRATIEADGTIRISWKELRRSTMSAPPDAATVEAMQPGDAAIAALEKRLADIADKAKGISLQA